jgi:hypothetical protein
MRGKRAPMDHAERIAKAAVETVIHGSRMTYREDQSVSVPDYELRLPDGRSVALEVTTSMVEPLQKTIAAIRDKRKGGPVIKTELCKRDWYIHPHSRANINRIRKEADAYLAAVESDGLKGFRSATDSDEYDSVARIYLELGVEYGTVMTWKTPGQIVIAHPSSGGFVDPSRVQDAVNRELSKEDNRVKLAAAATEERHLFVYIDPRNHIAWVPLVDMDPPTEPPYLPPEITHVWAASESRAAGEYLVWRANGKGWEGLGSLPLKP